MSPTPSDPFAAYQKPADSKAASGDPFAAYQKPATPQDIDKLDSSAPVRFMGRIAENLNPVPVLGAITHPRDTAKAIWDQTSQKVHESVVAAGRGEYGRSALSFAESFPLVGSVISQGEEDVKSGNYAGLAGTAASVAIPEIAGRGIPRLGKALGAPEALEEAGARQYSRVMGATTRPNKFIGRQVVEGTPASKAALGLARGTEETPGMLERGVKAFTRRGLQKKVYEHIADVGQQLEQEWAKLPPGEGVPLDAVNNRLTQAGIEKFAAETPGGQFLPTGPAGASRSTALRRTPRATAARARSTRAEAWPSSTARRACPPSPRPASHRLLHSEAPLPSTHTPPTPPRRAPAAAFEPPIRARCLLKAPGDCSGTLASWLERLQAAAPLSLARPALETF